MGDDAKRAGAGWRSEGFFWLPHDTRCRGFRTVSPKQGGHGRRKTEKSMLPHWKGGDGQTQMVVRLHTPVIETETGMLTVRILWSTSREHQQNSTFQMVSRHRTRIK